MINKDIKKNNKSLNTSVLDMNGKQAFEFFMEEENYCAIELPPYFTFKSLLQNVDEYLNGNNFKVDSKIKNFEGVNYRVYSNKEGKYNWRPLEIINPFLYVDLLKKITSEDNWKLLHEKFEEFQNNSKIVCLSIPVKSNTKRKNKSAQILKWWTDVEQESIKLSLEYNYLYHTDISDCYPSIYTHTIAWAIHGKDIAKKQRNDNNLLGNIIDSYMQCMHHGQTNGIPQGSVLMDFIAEIILGYADEQLTKMIKEDKIEEYKILRYRDDYRIFVNNPIDGEKILKFLTEILLELGLKLNSLKTKMSSQVIVSSIKIDKYEWLLKKQKEMDIQRQLLIIHNHGMEFLNSGSLSKALFKFYNSLHKSKLKKNINPEVLISIVVDIAFNNPRTIPVCFSIISKLLSSFRKDESLLIINKMHEKFNQLPNNGFIEVWLQRISYPLDNKTNYKEILCEIVKGKYQNSIWNNKWLPFQDPISMDQIVNNKILQEIKPIIEPTEVNIFVY